MLRFSANLSLLFTEVPLLERFQRAKQAGFSAVEIQFPYALAPEELKQLLNDLQLDLVLFNIDADDLLQGGEGLASVPEKTAQFRQALEQTVRYAELLKPYAINVLPGRCFRPEYRSKYLDTFTTNLALAVEALHPLGIKTVFEAINTFDMPNFMIHNQDQMLAILDELKDPGLFMQYDLYHMARMGQDFNSFITRHTDQIGHIQFADSPGRGQPGTGELDFKSIFQTIADSAYSGWVGAEYHPQGTTEASLSWLKG